MKKQKQKTISEKTLVLTIFLITLLSLLSLISAEPTGPSWLNVTSNDSGGTASAQMVNISGGVISKFNLTVSQQNTRWKAFLGWIDGRFTLDDSLGSTIYDWTASITQGEVYATRESTTIDWDSIGCANAGQITTEDTNLAHTGGDNITSTFTDPFTGSFTVAVEQIDNTDNCMSTNTYVGGAQTAAFEEVILYDSTTSAIVFATILEENATGYDGDGYDFQMIVPENGSASWSSSTAYYLYVELG